MAERDLNPPNRTDHTFQDAQGRRWNYSTVSSTSLNDAQQPLPPSTPLEPISAPATLSERQAEDDLFEHIDELIRVPQEYSWENKVTLSDKAEWCYKAIWVGRNQGNYKCHPEFLHESTRSLALNAMEAESS